MPMDGSELRRHRRRLKLTQVEMAKKIGIHSNSLARMERNEMNIGEPVARLVRILATAKRAKG